MKKLYFLFTILCAALSAQAQTFSISGTLLDASDTSSMIEVSVVVEKAGDSTDAGGTVTDDDGKFEIDGLAPGKYTLTAAYLGYTPLSRTVTISNANVALGTLTMKSSSNQLHGVTVTGKEIRAEQLGDTTQFNANAYKTNPDATAEDLVTKMPGVTSDNTGVKVNGETVQQVYVDGKPFFGTDPTLALKNLPSEVIDKIQVFDKLSDQSQFTGFDDGNSQKTINIITKKNKSNGEFGKVYAGYGTDNRDIAGGNLNIFDGDRRISILGLSNNINQQNFSSDDILGVTGNSSGRNRGGGGSAGNFLVGQQGGITKTNSAGFNYSDNWGKKIKVTGSYFYNGTDNTNVSTVTRDYFTSNDSALIYNEYDNSRAKNYNNRVNFRFEYTIDSFNSLIITPAVSFQQNYTQSSTNANDSLAGALSSTTQNNTTNNNTGYNFSNNILFQHKFRKPRRTLSVNVGTSLNEKDGDGSFYALNNYYSSTHALDTSTLQDQKNTLYNNGYTLSANVNYTEPIGKKGQLMVNYNPSYTKSRADKETYDNNGGGSYTDFDSVLSNKYNNTYVTQRAGVNYRIGDRKLSFSIGANLQYATLDGVETFPYSYNLNKTFTDVLPTANFNYRFADGRNLRIIYRTSTTAPSITQLQDVLDISNPLLLKTGNANLRQDFEHNLTVRYGLTKPKSAHVFFVYLLANYINNYIGNATYIPQQDSTFKDPSSPNSILIQKGSQLTRPVNLNGYWNTKAFVTYGIPADFIKSNLNFNGGFTYTQNPGMVNSIVNYSDNYVPTFGVVVSSNVSENLDFTLSYSGSYNVVKNSVQAQANNDYYSHTASFKINWIFLKGVVFNTSIAQNYYTAFSNSGDQNYLLWNAYIGYKFLKNKALEARITAFDILKQNKSISRTVTDTYIENDVTQVLQQYFMFQLTYTLRNFHGTAMPDAPAPDDSHPHNHGGLQGGPGGGPGGGGPGGPGGGGDWHQ